MFLGELNSYPLQNGTAWHCSWSGNPQFSSLLGIGRFAVHSQHNGAQLHKSDELFYSSISVAGSKQALLVDAVKESSVCKIRSSSDVFCIEFGKKVRIFRVVPSS